MLLVTTIVSQLVFSSASHFPFSLGSMMVENIPFLHTIGASVYASVEDPERSGLSTVLVCYAIASILSGVAFAVVGALKEAIQKRIQRESPSETARRLLASRGLVFAPGRQPVGVEVWHDLDHNLDKGA